MCGEYRRKVVRLKLIKGIWPFNPPGSAGSDQNDKPADQLPWRKHTQLLELWKM